MKYIEITFLPTADIPINYLWSKVFYKIHHKLVQLQDENGLVRVGFSFPQYVENPPKLGNKLRIFCNSETELTALDLKNYLRIFNDYLHIINPRNVDDRISSYAVFRRVQPNPSCERLARRKFKREGISYDEALEKLLEYEQQEKPFSLPYIQLKSDSSHNKFSLFIKKQKGEKKDEFLFNTYGLSKGGTVPDF